MQAPIILYDNRFLDGTLTATDTESGYDVNNIKDWRPYTFWKAASAGTKYITVDCGSAKKADCIAVLGHNLFSASGAISVESSDDDIAWVTQKTITPTSDFAFLKTFTSVSARYWRLKIVTASIAPYLAVALLGEKLQFEYPQDTPCVPYEEKPVADVERTKDGHIIGVSTYLPMLGIRAQFSNFTRTWIDNNYRPFWQNHARLFKPFFYAWDIDTYPNDIFFVTIDDSMVFGTQFSISSYVDMIALTMRGVREI